MRDRIDLSPPTRTLVGVSNDQVPVHVAPQRPVRTRRPATPVSWTIIGICTAVWLGELASPPFLDSIVLAPDLGRTEPWRFITSAFAHATNIAHIGFNMLAVWMLRGLETFLGRWRYIVLYLVSALGGSAVFVLLATPGSIDWYTGLVGASGAIFGLFGTLIVVYRHLRQPMTQIWIVLAINAVISFGVPGIAWQAHVGGLATGLAIGGIIIGEHRRALAGHRDRTLFGIGMLTAIIVVALVVKYSLAAGF